MAINLLRLGVIWGAAVGIILADVLYFFTDSLASFLLFIPCALIGYWLAKRALRKWGSVEEYLKGRK